MSISENIPSELFSQFDAIDLSALVSKAEMLERVDRKYIVSREDLQKLLAELAPKFDILEIEGKRQFAYETRYFDGDQFETYTDHLRGRWKRVKVRVRRYVHSGECFLEVKLKDRRGKTLKHRKNVDAGQFDHLGQDAVEFVNDNHSKAYGKSIAFSLGQALYVRYTRTTLIAKTGGERLTIDGDIGFGSPDSKFDLSGDMFIVETKSGNGNGLADYVLRRLHQRPIKHCSKYCIGLSMINQHLKINPFRPAIRKLVGQNYLASRNSIDREAVSHHEETRIFHDLHHAA